MKKYILLTILSISTLNISNLSSCPCEFSSEDQRPFFEQYEIEKNSTRLQEKEKKS